MSYDSVNVLIQCANRKETPRQYFVDGAGQRIMFVANPKSNHPDIRRMKAQGIVPVHPDDFSDVPNKTWRQLVKEYNDNPDGSQELYQAIDLYANSAYRELNYNFPISNLFILSDGWGIIPGNFLTPEYNIGVSADKDYQKRDKGMKFKDFTLLSGGKDLVCLCGRKAHGLLYDLTQNYQGKKILIYKGKVEHPLIEENFKCKEYKTNTRTNWYYEYAKKLARNPAFYKG